MTHYVLVREDGKYVARFGGERSYTNKLQNAQPFTPGEVERHRCGNEHAVTLEEAMGIR